ncbi:MAG TPA: prepilin-type N-terminal cleavage/methylation domain-containing protein [Terriglobales bacterium]|nr:prepilin-type N-terminal cleavage/methylation domain-containing protein [Terriglobales bacterium]
MKNTSPVTRRTVAPGDRGFSLLELLVASAIFLLIAGVAFTLFGKQQSSSQIVQGQVGLNLALRNAGTQLQLDLANAGSYYYQGVNIPSWPVGVSIVNNVVPSGSSCYNSTTKTYGASCFDQINIIAAANPTNFPPINATDTSGAAGTGNCWSTNTGNMYGQAASGLNLAQTAALFKQGDQLLFLDSTGTFFTTAVLTANAVSTGSAVKFTFNATNGDGSNSLANDPLDITACDNKTPCTVANKLQVQYCGNDFILKLAPITYSVDISTPSNPVLTRTQSGTTATVMEQVIGFKIGAATWNSSTDNDVTTCAGSTTITCFYNYDSSTYTNSGTSGAMAYNFSLVRAIRVSLIGRTAPSTDPNYKFRNAFDGGAYQVQGTAVVVNPRDMSMND